MNARTACLAPTLRILKELRHPLHQYSASARSCFLEKHDTTTRIIALLLFSACGLVFGQQRPPVILIDGYHLLCSSNNLVSSQEFGELEQRLQSEGVHVSFFGTCSFDNKPSIEDIAYSLGAAIRNLNVPEVDLVSHSMGGLIVRAYLSGKQSGAFTPPPDTHVRKWVSIATPNFGVLLPSFVLGYLPDQQAKELVAGSQFVFDLASWNQNQDDLRGVDAVGIIGNAGGFGSFNSVNDGTVAVTSASMSFALSDERTRILPYCHGAGGLTAILGLGCDAPPLARIQSDNPLSWNVIDSFLRGTADWKSTGHSPSQDKILSQYGGILRQPRNAMDQPTGVIQDQAFVANPPRLGGYSVVIDKPGPRIAIITPSQATLPGLSLTAGKPIAINGYNLEASTVSVNGQILVLNDSSPNQIHAQLPDNVSGLAKLTVRNNQGSQTVNVFVVSNTRTISHIADGAGFRTTFILLNTGSSTANFRLDFWNDTGGPLTLDLGSDGNTAALSGVIPPHGARFIRTAGTTSGLNKGWAELTAPVAVDGNSIFGLQTPGQGDSEAAVPLSQGGGKDLFLPFDNTPGFVTGVAFSDPGHQAAAVSGSFLDESGTAIIDSQTVAVPARGHNADVLANFFPVTQDKRGAAHFKAETNIFGLGIRSNGNAFTTIEALSGVTTVPKIIPHIASGGGWKTTFLLVNTGTAAARFTLDFFSDAGNPLPLPLDTLGTVGTITGLIPAGGLRVVKAINTGAVVTGWARLTVTGPISGTTIFALEAAGQPDSEAAVPFVTQGGTQLYLPFDYSPGYATGIAMTDVGPTPTAVTITILDEAGHSLAAPAVLVLQPFGHVSKVLSDLFPGIVGRRGTVSLIADHSIFALGIRADGLAFTSLKVIVR